MTQDAFGPEDATRLLQEVFAPWVAEIGLEPLVFSDRQARFRLPENPRLALRGGPGQGVLCGQAVAAVADTAVVLALSGANGRFRVCTTVDLSVSFIRPLSGPAEVTVDIESNGRKMAVARVSLRAEGAEKAAALATATFMYLED